MAQPCESWSGQTAGYVFLPEPLRKKRANIIRPRCDEIRRQLARGFITEIRQQRGD